MEKYDDKLCISHDELTDGIVSAATLQKMVQRKRVKRVRRACYGQSALYAVETLPHEMRAEVYRRRPDIVEHTESRPFMENIEPDGEAMAYYAAYTLPDGRHLPTDKQTELCNAAAVLRMMGHLAERANSHRLRQSRPKVNTAEFWRRAAAALPRINDQWYNTLPSNPRRLREKYEAFRREGYESLISRKYLNQNAARIISEEQQAVMTQLLAHHNNLDNADIASYYNRVATVKNWDSITASTVGVWRKKLDLVTAAGRRGSTNFRAERAMQVKRSRPTAPFLYWTLDGWTCELLYQQTATDRQGHSTTTYHNRLTLEVVLDPSCNYPIGYAIGTHETPQLIAEALRDAARHSLELTGQMLRACQIQCDHYAIKTMADLYQVMGEKVTPARVKNAKAKVVEPYFGYLNKTYCKKFANWSGYGVTTDPKRQPNAEAINMHRHSFPDEAACRQQIHMMMAVEREKKREELLRLMEQLPAERRLPLSKEQYLLHFGATTGQTNAIEGSGLRPTLLGLRRDYDCWDPTFREHAAEKWTVRYDPDDLTEVLAVNADGTRRYMLAEKYVQPMALADRSAGDAAALERVQDFNRRLEQSVSDRLALTRERTLAIAADAPQVEDILSRLLITDSRGQHKLPKARARLSAAQMAEVEVETVEQPERPLRAAAEDPEDYNLF